LFGKEAIQTEEPLDEEEEEEEPLLNMNSSKNFLQQ